MKEEKIKTRETAKKETTEPPEEIPVGTITFGAVTWSGGQASIRVSTTSGYEIEYQLNGTAEGRWTSVPSNGTISNIPYNATVNVRLVNGSKRGQVQSKTIKDETVPKVIVTKQGSATTNSIAVSVQATDNESGMSTSPTYTYFIKKTSEGSYTQKASNANNSYTFTGLDQETSYDIKVEVQGDKAGNKGEGTLTGITTGKVTGGTVEGAITFGNPTWSDGQASITISTNTSYKIEYQLNGTEGSWTEISNNGTIQNLAHNTTIYARLTDGNNHGDHASTTIADTVNPTVTIQSLTAEDTTIQVTAKGTDNETGINEYIFYIKESTQEDSNYVEKTRNTTGTATIEGLETGKTYTIKVEVTDKANNTGSTTKDIKVTKPITGEEISANASEHYRGIVTNYDCKNNDGVDAWEIFYADENNIYLISDNYVSYQFIPQGRGGSDITIGDTYYCVYTSDSIENEYNGSSDITDEKIRALNNDFFSKGYTSTKNNMKTVAYMLDTDIWNVFAGEQAEYAIGGPTLELFFKSYNQKFNTSYMVKSEEDGYSIWETEDYYMGTEVYLDKQDSLYFNHRNGVYGMWMPTPSQEEDYIVYTARSGGQVGTISSHYFQHQTGFRPVVCLKSGIGLEKQEDGTYRIIDTIETGNITFNNAIWEDNKASMQISTDTNLQIEYQINGIDEGKWKSIENNGTIQELINGDTVYARLTDGTNYGDYASVTVSQNIPGRYFDKDTEIMVGEYPVTVPAGATISGIPGEYESVEDGLVIYITNGEIITNWADARTMHENYDQFVWVPVDKDSVIVEEGKEITVATNKEKYDNLKGYIAYYNKYPMAVKKSDGTYSVLLYDFEGDSNLKITPKDYTAVTDYIEPAVLEEDEKHNITAIDMDERYKIYGRMELYYIFEIYGKLWI